MDAKVEVREVVQLGGEDPLLRAASIDRPSLEQPGRGAPGGWSLDVRGAAAGAQEPVTEVELSVFGTRLRRVPCDSSHRFYATLGALDLPADFELRVEAVLAGAQRAAIGLIRGSRAPLTTTFTARLQPLMVTGPGRAGSTIFMQMLGAHPQIAAHPPFDEEARVATYWVDVLRALARPQSWMRQIAPAGPLNDAWWLGDAHPAPRRLRSQPLQEWLAGQVVEDIAAFAQARIEAVYTQIQAGPGESGARFFAEKVRNDVVSDLLWELYPAAREVVLVRDPRDVLVSILATTRKRGVQPGPDDPHAWVGDEFTDRIMAVLESWRRRADQVLLVRYEDLMLRPRETLAEVLGYAGLGDDGEAVDAMLAAAGRRLPGMDEHRTSADVDSSIGRWRRELEPPLLAACEHSVADALTAWGYASSSAEATVSPPT
jgi:sulfotransferase family protein